MRLHSDRDRWSCWSMMPLSLFFPHPSFFHAALPQVPRGRPVDAHRAKTTAVNDTDEQQGHRRHHPARDEAHRHPHQVCAVQSLLPQTAYAIISSCHATCNASAGHAARAQAITKAIHQHLHAPLSSSPPRSSKSGQQHLSRVFFDIRDLTANVRASALEPNEHARDRLPIDTRKRSPTRDACASDGASARSALACSMA